jgi:DNA-binding response OmpR family regulator
MISEVRVLVVFDSGAIRKLLSRFLMSELENVSVFVAGDCSEAAHVIRGQPLDVIVAESALVSADDGALYRAARGSARNRETPFIVVGNERAEDVSRWIRAGSFTILGPPFNAADLHACVRAVFNARSKRSVDRFHVEGAEVHVASPAPVTGSVINLSTQALLAEVVCRHDALDAMMRVALRLELPLPGGRVGVEVGEARLLKLQTLDWPDDDHIRMRIVWHLRVMNDTARDRLTTALMDVRTFSPHTMG